MKLVLEVGHQWRMSLQLETKKIVSKESHYWLLQTERKHVEKSPDSGVTVNPMRTQDMLECKGENVGTQET